VDRFPAKDMRKAMTRAMVLAAGLGTRMRPLTDTLPKPLIKVAGRALIDHVLDRLADAGIETAVVNVHHMANQIEAHLKRRTRPRIEISDERRALLDTGGGVVKALRLLGDAPFLHMNSDTLWIEGVTPNLARLGAQFDPARMDILLLLASATASIGYEGRGDFAMAPDGRLRRRVEREVTPFVYAGAAMLDPAQFADAPAGKFSLNRMFDRAIAAGRMYGLRLDGTWMHIGTPAAIEAAEKAIAESVA
jgi:N-acetyl-alpha-D-muramate 1-phosphate uridylyltransferase